MTDEIDRVQEVIESSEVMKTEKEKTKKPEKEKAGKSEKEMKKTGKELAQKPEKEKEDVPLSEAKPQEEKEIVSEDKPEKEEETEENEPETDAKRVKVKVTNYSPAKIAGLQVIITSTKGSFTRWHQIPIACPGSNMYCVLASVNTT
jgi:hypothetical protein